MSALPLLLALSFVFVLLMGAILWWAIFSGQFDEVQQLGETILQDDDAAQPCRCEEKEQACFV